MATVHRYITNEYKTLLHNAALALSLMMLAVIGTDIVLAIIAPNWSIRLFVVLGIIMSISATWLLYIAVRHFIDHRDQIVVAKWVGSYMCLFIGMLPILLFIYLNLDWLLFATYGRMAIDIYLSFDNIVLTVALMLMISLIYWTLTIQLYKKSHTTYLCINKKKEVYGK